MELKREIIESKMKGGEKDEKLNTVNVANSHVSFLDARGFKCASISN